VVRVIRQVEGVVDVTLVEGAGGWFVPLTAAADIADLALDLGYPVIVVARATLGTINHSLLTLRAVEQTGLSVAALVLSRRPGDAPDLASDNVRQIRERWRGQVVVLADDPSVLDVCL
jgi:dethiobiotin synthetase